MAGTKSNPDNIGVDNEYAGFVAPSRPDQSTVAAPGGYYGGSGGNTVDRSRINKTHDGSTRSGSKAKPLGQPTSTGY